MPKQATDYLKEARKIARDSNLYFVEIGTEFKLYRKTPARPVYLGKRSSAANLCSFVKRCASAK